MSFEISTGTGDVRLLSAVNLFDAEPSSKASDYFVDYDGRQYSASFDGENAIFNHGAASSVGRWLQGTSATVIKGVSQLGDGSIFIFVDHGPKPQRLHAIWTFCGSVEDAIANWKLADFSLSNIDRHLNRKHPASIHLRTKGAFGTGADSSHVTILMIQTGNSTSGEIHIGEFNPLTGLGIGFLLHRLERWM